MSDLISKQDIIEKLRKHKALFCKNRIEYSSLSKDEKARVDEIDNCIAELLNAPSIESKPESNNYIDKIAKKLMESGAAESISKMTVDESWKFISILGLLTEASKREYEKIIRCKECKFYTPMRRDLKTGICAIHSNNFGDDGFCSDAERI